MFFLEHGPKNVSTTRGERKEHKREIDLRRLTIDAYVFLFSFPGHSRTRSSSADGSDVRRGFCAGASSLSSTLGTELVKWHKMADRAAEVLIILCPPAAFRGAPDDIV